MENIDFDIQSFERMKADMGGANIRSALNLIFRHRAVASHPISVFLITDGGENNFEKTLNTS
jgi:hypothetical protein